MGQTKLMRLIPRIKQLPLWMKAVKRVSKEKHEETVSCWFCSIILRTCYKLLGENTPLGRQVSPDKLYRAALLRSRFADTIIKAQEKALEKVGYLRYISCLLPAEFCLSSFWEWCLILWLVEFRVKSRIQINCGSRGRSWKGVEKKVGKSAV